MLGMMRAGTPIQDSNYKPVNTWYKSTDHPQVHTDDICTQTQAHKDGCRQAHMDDKWMHTRTDTQMHG